MAGGAAGEGCTAGAKGDGAEEAGRRHIERGGGGAQRGRWRWHAVAYGGAATGTEGGGCDGGRQ